MFLLLVNGVCDVPTVVTMFVNGVCVMFLLLLVNNVCDVHAVVSEWCM